MASVPTTGKEECSLLTAEAGELTGAASVAHTATSPSGRWPLGRRAMLAAALLGVVSASAVATVLLRRGPATRATTEMPLASSNAPETTAAVQLFERHRTCGACQCDCDWVRVQNACSADAQDPQCCWSCCCAGVVDSQNDMGHGGLREHPVQQVGYNPALVYPSDAHFVTHVHHDALPVNRGEVYRGTGYPYNARSYYYHEQQASGLGASVWWIVLFLTLSVLGCAGFYYYFYYSKR